MKKQKPLTRDELKSMLAFSMREMNNLNLNNDKLPEAINRARANAIGTQAALKLGI